MRRLVGSVMLFLFLSCILLFVPSIQATIFGNIRGIVHDPQHRPVAGATVKLKSATSEWTQTVQTDSDGWFSFSAVPVGDYILTVSKSSFADMQETTTVLSDTSPVLHFQLKLLR